MEARFAIPMIRRISIRALVALAFVSASCAPTGGSEPWRQAAQPLLGDGLVISQVFGGGGNSGAAWNQDFVELFNASGAPVSLSGLSVQYAGQSAAFSSASDITALPNVMVPAGGYFLIAMGPAGATGSALPTPGATGSSTLAATTGKVALARVTTSLGCGATGDPCPRTNVVDLVGYGSASDYETAPVGALSNTTAAVRNAAGCADTNDNSADFSRVAPSPRSSASAVRLCASDAGAADAGDASPTDVGIASDSGADATIDPGFDAGADVAVGAMDATDDTAASADAGAAEHDAEIDAAIDVGTVESDAALDTGIDAGSATDVESTDTPDVALDAGPLGAGLVISQVYGGGGNSGAPFNQDFVELFNLSDGPVSLRGLSLQYGSAATGFGSAASTGLTALPDVTLAPRRYYLVAMGATGSNGTALPTADFMGPSTLASTDGKIALARITSALGCGATGNRCASTNVVDMVGYGAASDYEGSAAAPALSNTRAAIRRAGGCSDTDDNAADFTAATPTPRNTGSEAATCVVVLDAGRDVVTVDAPTLTDVGDGAVEADAPDIDATMVDAETPDVAADVPAEDRVQVDTATADLGMASLDAGIEVDTGAMPGGSAPADCSCRAAGRPVGHGPTLPAVLLALGALLRRRTAREHRVG